MAKKIGNVVYVHVSAIDTLHKTLQTRIHRAKAVLPAGWFFNVVKVSTNSNEVSFIYSAGFDALDEPPICSSVKVTEGVCSRVRYESKDNPTIYHGKHLFVKPDYVGFDVKAAQRRYLAWKNSGVSAVAEISKIGRLRYWNDIAIPALRSAGVF